MGTAYAVWGGIGAVGTVAVGILWFHEPAGAMRLALILAIVVAIVALRLTDYAAPAAAAISERATRRAFLLLARL